MLARRKVVLTLLVSSVFLLSLLIPLNAPPVTPLWRLINPTEYTTVQSGKANMYGAYMLNGGTSGKGSGNGWMVGEKGLLFQWDGFSWNQATVAPATDCQLNSVNFGGPLNPLSSITSSAGWVVGGVHDGGSGPGCTGPVAYFYNGISWVSYSTPPGYGSGELRGVSLVRGGSSGTDIQAFAVGTENGGLDGSFVDWNGVPGVGGGWTHLATVGSAGNPMNSVYMTHCSSSPCSADDGISVGNNGKVFRWNGGSWTNVATTAPAVNLNGVAMSSQTSGWAVGDNCDIFQTVDGTTWTGPVSPTTCGAAISLRSITLLSSSEGWIVGDQLNGVATIIHGTSLDSAPNWQKIPVNQVSSAPGLNSVTFASSGGNIWAAGNAGVAGFCFSNCSSPDGAIWSTTTSPALYDVNAVFMSGDSDAFAVGNLDSSLNPTFLRWDGGTYSWRRAAFVSPVTIAPLYGIFQTSGSAAWAVGGTGPGVPSTFWYDGNTWTGRTVGCTGPCPQFQFRGVYMVSDSNSWAVGGYPAGPHIGVIMHSPSPAGTQFQSTPEAPALQTTDLYSVYFDPGSGGNSGWVVGGNGGASLPVIAHTITGGADAWATIINPAGVPAGVILKSIFMQDGTHGWAAGTGTTIVYWDGNSWTPVGVTINAPFVGPIDIRGIAVLGGPPANDGYAVGVDANNLPVVIHYDGTSWSTFPSPAIPNTGALNGLSLRSSTNGLAVGTQIPYPVSDPATLGLIVHLDPPGGVTASNTGNPPSTQTTQQLSSSATSSSTTTSASTSTSSSSTTAVSTSVTTTAISTPSTTSTSSTSSVSTPLALPPIPGFPWESIIAGVILGMTALAILRRRRK